MHISDQRLFGRNRPAIVRCGNMKTYVICAVFILAPVVFGSFANSIDDVVHAYEAECAAVSRASGESIEAARRARQLPQSPEMNSFAMCMLGKNNVMAADGSINPNVRSYSIITDVPDNTWRVSEQCKTLNGNDVGETARMIMNCYLDNNQMVLAMTPRFSS